MEGKWNWVLLARQEAAGCKWSRKRRKKEEKEKGRGGKGREKEKGRQEEEKKKKEEEKEEKKRGEDRIQGCDCSDVRRREVATRHPSFPGAACAPARNAQCTC